MHPLVSLNGRLETAAHATLSPFDRGFTLGDGLFETMIAVNGTVWYLDRHLGRLCEGAARIGITVPPMVRQWTDAVIQHAAQEVADGRGTAFVVRIIVTRGVAHVHGLAGQVGQNALSPTVAILAFDLVQTPAAVYAHGLRVQVASARRDERALSVGLKTTSYIEPILALRAANAAGFDDVLFLDTRGFVAEASTSNIFVWLHDTLITPPLTCGILPGITRGVVLALAAQMGLPIAEREFTLAELRHAEEGFLTSSLRGIVPLVSVDNDLLGHGRPGPVTQRLAAAYAAVQDRIC